MLGLRPECKQICDVLGVRQGLGITVVRSVAHRVMDACGRTRYCITDHTSAESSSII